jgi:DMATS type aromatic prenyltransferase
MIHPISNEGKSVSVPQELDDDSVFWWKKTSPILENLMQWADYDHSLQSKYMRFYGECITPLLGRRLGDPRVSREWSSFMTDDTTPLEFSCSWISTQKKPIVRFSMEPTGKLAGSSDDLFNLQILSQSIEVLRPWLSQLDLQWFDRLSNELVVRPEHIKERANALVDHSSQIFFAFDLREQGLALKAYFLPVLKSAETNLSRWALIRRAVTNLAGSPSMNNSITTFAKYMETRSKRLQLEAEIVGIDCVSPSASRIKIYVRSRMTAFEDVEDILTLGGSLSFFKTERSSVLLEKLWQDLFNPRSKLPQSSLEKTEHRTGGMLYYFEFHNGSDQPVPKVYLPVRHYAQNDLQIAKGLEEYLKSTISNFRSGSYVSLIKKTLSVTTFPSAVP